MAEKVEINWKLVDVPIKTITEHPRNPRQISKDQINNLTKSLDEFGIIEKPILNDDFCLIGGHQRLKILKKMKKKSIECWVPDVHLTDKQVDKLCILLNKAQGSFDWDIMANQWEPLDLLEAGFTEDELVGNYEKYNKEIMGESEEEKNSSKKKSCPNCGHEF